jgi:hypothetical protein
LKEKKKEERKSELEASKYSPFIKKFTNKHMIREVPV